MSYINDDFLQLLITYVVGKEHTYRFEYDRENNEYSRGDKEDKSMAAILRSIKFIR